MGNGDEELHTENKMLFIGAQVLFESGANLFDGRMM
jgi:hypothetical protein